MDARHQLFAYSSKDFVYDVCRPNGKRTQVPSRFDAALRSGWTEKMSRGLFRYHLGDLETRILAGECGYVAQLNIERGVERRKPQEIVSTRQSFNPELFNFNKIKPEEVLFELRRAEAGSTEEGMHEGGGGGGGGGCCCKVIINVSPLEFGHCLLVPEPAQCLPQLLTPPAVQFGVESVLLSADPGFRVGFNSLGAFASVNHLHLHGYYLNHTLRLEWARADLIHPHERLYRLADFPNAFMFYTDGRDLRVTVSAVCRLTDVLLDRDVAHNVFMTRGCAPGEDGKASPLRHGVRILIWPRKSCFGSKEESALNVALCELAGHLPFKNREDFESIDEAGVKAIIQTYVVSDEEFNQIEKHILERL